MPAVELTVEAAGPAANDEVDTCAACPHSWTFHDRIAVRFCAATTAGKFSRGCVCTPYPEKEIR